MDEQYQVELFRVKLSEIPSGVVRTTLRPHVALRKMKETGKSDRYVARGSVSELKTAKDWITGKVAEHFIYKWLTTVLPNHKVSQPDDEFRSSGGDGWSDFSIDYPKGGRINVSVKSTQKPEKFGWTFQNIDPLSAHRYALLWVSPNPDHSIFYTQIAYWGPLDFTFGEMKYAAQRSNKRAVYMSDNPNIVIDREDRVLRNVR